MYGTNRRSNVLKFLRTACQMFGHWSLNSGASKWRIVLLESFYWIILLNQVYALVAIINGLHCCFSAVNQLIKSSVDIVFGIETSFGSLYVRWRRNEFRRLANRMEQFFATTAGVSLTRPTTVSYILLTTFFVGNLLYGTVPLFTSKQETPISTVYFTLPREKHWGRSIIYTLNVVQIVSVSSFLFLDMLIIFIIWHAACQFHLLANRFTVSNEKKLQFWIKEHQDALRYANEINSVIGPLAVKSTFAVALNIIIAGLVVTNRKLNMVELSKFFTVTAFSMLRFFACTWIAGTMTENAQNISRTIYDSPWIYSSPRIRKLAVMVMHRCQKPVAIRWPGIVSAWTLRFYNQVLRKIITYLMTLRAIIRVV